MKNILPLALLLTTCRAPLDKDKFDATIQQLRSGLYQSTAFLNLKYGDPRPVVAQRLEQLRDAGTVASNEPYREGEQPLPSVASGFSISAS